MNIEMTNAEYHSNLTHLSSSALKYLYDDHEKFIKYYVNREKTEPSPALVFGTAIHTAILEPHLFDSEIIIYPEQYRRGNSWKEFALQHPNSNILTMNEKTQLDALVEACNNSKLAKELLTDCKFEHTLMTELDGLPVKCRCDGINIEKGYIIDVKTTRYDSSSDSFKMALQEHHYDLSAELYRQIASSVYNKEFDFYFIVLSKADYKCRVYKTSSKTFATGQLKLLSAYETYKHFKLTGAFEPDILESENEIMEV